MDPDEREHKLPQWARERLTGLRSELDKHKAYAAYLQEDCDKRRDEMEAKYDAVTSDVRYETEYDVQYLKSGGTVTFLIGKSEISVSATGEGVKVQGGGGIVVHPVSPSWIQIDLEKP